jgi:hypothetical protein
VRDGEVCVSTYGHAGNSEMYFHGVMRCKTARLESTEVHVKPEVAVHLIVASREERIMTERNSNTEAAGHAFPPA